MKKFSHYTVVKYFNEKWENRFYDAMTWIDKQLYRIPVFLQFEVQVTTPRSSRSESGHNYWWFPEISVGRNKARDKINDFNWFKVWSAYVEWLGIFIGVGLCVKCKKPEPVMVCIHCNQQNIGGTQCCSAWDGQEKERK